jgi:hypothetical protein
MGEEHSWIVTDFSHDPPHVDLDHERAIKETNGS